MGTSPKDSSLTITELEPFYTEVGRIASAWANMEFEIDRLLWDLSEGQHMLAACITSQLTNAGARIRALIGLVRLREGSKELITKLNQFDAATNLMGRKRNRVVHDPWHYNSAKSVAAQLSIAIEDKALTFDFMPKTLPEIKNLYEDIKVHVNKFLVLDGQIREALLSPSSSQKWREQLHEIADA